MEVPNVFIIAQFAVPMYMALICGLLYFRLFRLNESALGRKNLSWVLYASGFSVFGWLSLTFYVGLPKIFVFLNPLVLLTYMMVHVMYYRFIFELTRINSRDRFSFIHYIVPVIVFIVMAIWSCFVPFDVQLELVESQELALSGEYKYYALFFTNKLSLFFLYDMLYAMFGLIRTVRFRRTVINYSADEHRISLTWLYLSLFIVLAALPMTIVVFFLPNSVIVSSGIALFPVAIIMLKDIIMVHNVLLENYVLIKSDLSVSEKCEITEGFSEESCPLAISNLENYMNEKKPYLNPRLKITDMTAGLNTNRTSLSLLINRTYGMNFNRFINRYRLKELERLKANPAYSQYDEMELIALAGFSDYRGYKRFKKREEINMD